MANLPEEAAWRSGIYQIEMTDPVVGGPDGISNIQARQLGDRTAHLKMAMDNARGGFPDLAARLGGMQDAIEATLPPAADELVQARVAEVITTGARLVLQADQTAYLDIGEGGHFPIGEIQRALNLAASWDGCGRVVVRLRPGEHVMTVQAKAPPGALTIVEGWRGADGKLWAERTIEALSIAPGGPLDPALPLGAQRTVITATLDSVSGIVAGQTIRLACDEWASSTRTAAQIEVTDACAGVFRVVSVTAATRRMVVHGVDRRTAFPVQPVPVGHKCLVPYSWCRTAVDFAGGAFVAGDSNVGLPRSDLRLNLALDVTDSRGRSVGALAHYGSTLTWRPYELWIHGADRNGIWAIGADLCGHGLCVSGCGANVVGQEGHRITLFQPRLTQARDYAAVSSLFGSWVSSLGHFHGGHSTIYCNRTNMSTPYARSHGGFYAAHVERGQLTLEGHVTEGRSYLHGERGAMTILGGGPTGSAIVQITEATDFGNRAIAVRGGGLLLGVTAAPLTGVARGRVTNSGGWIGGVDEMPTLDLGVTFFVNSATGSDTTGDGSAGAPYATIRQAIRSAPSGCALTINLLSDYSSAGRTAESVVNKPFQFIRIQGANVNSARIKRTWTFANHDHGDGTYSVGGLVFSELHGPIDVTLDSLGLRFPAAPETGTPSPYNALIGRDLHALGPSRASLRLLRCDIERPAAATAWIVGASRGFVELDVQAGSWPTAQAGKWIDGAGAAGAAAPAWARLRGLTTL
ncbi:hypothetical protein [Neomegalonema sp.]|uniref:hypothetical protein n=1 Tax=Neomegalonema sp. TaxID=2039713 RepID=UPI002629EA1B|nr:hypothetical protein [Neomegalonema sp.]MDD2870071.1 hypothetical protein [Neomegalonema sp.]